MKVTDIKPNPNNPRIIKDDKFKKLVKSIQDFPQMLELRPMIVDNDNVLLGGNMRLKAIQELGMKDIPDTWVKKASELTEEQKKEFIIKDNVGFGEWDWDMLGNEWEAEQLNDWGLDVPDFEGGEGISAGDAPNFNYTEQYGVIVICDSETMQETVFNKLKGEGFNCRIVAT